MAHYSLSLRERVIALIESGARNISEAGEEYGFPACTASRWWNRYQETGYAARLPRPRGSGRISTADEDARVVDLCEREPFWSSTQLQQESGFPGSSSTVRRRLKEVGIQSRRAAVKDILTEANRVDRLAFAEVNANRCWDNVIFTDEKTFSSANDGPRLVYRRRHERYAEDKVVHSQRSGRVTVSCWGWVAARGGGILHPIDGHLNSIQYLHILENVMIPSVRLLYPDGMIMLQQDHSPIHDSQVVQNWLARRGDIELVDWPPRGADLSPIENVWAEVTRVMKESWPDPPPRTRDALLQCVSDAWDDACAGPTYIRGLINSLPRRMRQVIDAEGYWIGY